MSTIRTDTDLELYAQELDEVRNKLQQVVDIVNHVGELLEIATEVVEIAAGLMKL